MQLRGVANFSSKRLIFGALLEREVTGQGRWVHTSLLESMISVMDFQAARYTVAGEVPSQAGNDHPRLAPMGAFETADGMVNIAASSDKMFHDFCKILSAEHLIQNPKFADSRNRFLNRKDLNLEINEITRTLDTAFLVEKLNEAGCPCGPINTIDQTFADPQVQHLEVSKPADHPSMGEIGLIKTPINMPDIPEANNIRRVAPKLGEHTAEILAEYGFSPADIKGLKKSGVV